MNQSIPFGEAPTNGRVTIFEAVVLFRVGGSQLFDGCVQSGNQRVFPDVGQ